MCFELCSLEHIYIPVLSAKDSCFILYKVDKFRMQPSNHTCHLLLYGKQ